MLGHSETERCAQIYPAAGQPSPAKTLLHRGPTQGTCSQGLMANRLIARYFCTQPIQHNRVPHDEHLFYALSFSWCFCRPKKLTTTARRPNQVKHSIIRQRYLKLETVLICEYVIGFRSMQCGWVSTGLPPYRSYLQRLAFMHALSDAGKNPNPNCPA